MVRDVGLVPMSDMYIWSLEGYGDFSVASIRKVIDNKFLPNVSSKTRWVKCVPIKVNILAWKVKMDALPVRFNLSRRDCAQNFFMADVDYVDANSYEEWLDWLGSLRLPAKLKLMIEWVFYV
nr:RNA-directed DNA polymerase, eukaryota [Tanacetum cinerariifolium]